MPTEDPQPSQKIEHSSIQGSKIQQGQAENLTQIQAENLTQVFIRLFGNKRRNSTNKLQLDLLKRFLRNEIQPELKRRLRDTVHLDVWLNPELEEQPHQVGGLAPGRTIQVLGQSSETLDLQTTILEVFNLQDIDKKLLILGEPGVGKTTTLLTLADQLAQQALTNSGRAIPVIFELSAWKNDNQSIREWLIEQLQKIYKQRPETTQRWLEAELIIPLLDGLDELGLERQCTCIQRINEFAAYYPYLVVCCRVEEYGAAQMQLHELRGAVCLNPLTLTQVQKYLQQIGQDSLWEEITALPKMQAMLQVNDEKKTGILRIPLFLKIAGQVGTPFESKEELLNAYVNKQLGRYATWDRQRLKGRKWVYSEKREPTLEQTIHRLNWLAQNLLKSNQTDFLIEQMQPIWLSAASQKLQYCLIFLFFWLTTCLLIGLLIPDLIFGMLNAPNGPSIEEIYGTAASTNSLPDENVLSAASELALITIFFGVSLLLLGLCNWLLLSLFRSFLNKSPLSENSSAISKKLMEIRTVEALRISTIYTDSLRIFRALTHGLVRGYLGGVFIQLLGGIFIQFAFLFTLVGTVIAFIIMLIMSPVFPILPLGIVSSVCQLAKYILAILKFPKKNLESFEEKYFLPTFAIIYFCLTILCAGFFLISAIRLIYDLIVSLESKSFGQIVDLDTVIQYIAFTLIHSPITLTISILGALIGLLVSLQVKQKQKIYPNEGIWISFFTMFVIGGLFYIGTIIVTKVSFLAALLAVTFGFYFGGGITCIQHLSLRLVFYTAKVIPWNYACFLNYCVERRLLQRVGGRYRFLHRELLEYFARKAGGVS